MRQSGLLLDDNRDVSEACVTRLLVEIDFVRELRFELFVCVFIVYCPAREYFVIMKASVNSVVQNHQYENKTKNATHWAFTKTDR